MSFKEHVDKFFNRSDQGIKLFLEITFMILFCLMLYITVYTINIAMHLSYH